MEPIYISKTRTEVRGGPSLDFVRVRPFFIGRVLSSSSHRSANLVPGTILLPIGLFITGWTVQAHTHWIGPDIVSHLHLPESFIDLIDSIQQGLFLVGAGNILVFQGIQTYVIDSYSLHAASAMAAVSFLRSLAGFGFPLFAPAMYSALGYGKGDTVLAVCAIVIGCPAYVFFLA